jgi:hypothetical protein
MVNEQPGTVYRCYWLDANQHHQEIDWPSLTEATIHKLKLRRRGFVARIVRIVTTIGG